MRAKIIAIYLTSILIMFLCSCSQSVDTPARFLRSNTWTEKSSNNVNLSLSFKDDNAILKIKEKDKENIITGITVVTDDKIKITDINTLNEYVFKYNLKGDSVDLSYENKRIHLILQ